MKEKSMHEVDNNPLEKPTSYQIRNRTFVVEPIFRKDGKETLGTIFLRLMRKDVESLDFRRK